MNKLAWRVGLKEAAKLFGCALLVLAFAYLATVLALSLESNAGPQETASVSSPPEPAAPAFSRSDK